MIYLLVFAFSFTPRLWPISRAFDMKICRFKMFDQYENDSFWVVQQTCSIQIKTKTRKKFRKLQRITKSKLNTMQNDAKCFRTKKLIETRMKYCLSMFFSKNTFAYSIWVEIYNTKLITNKNDENTRQTNINTTIFHTRTRQWFSYIQLLLAMYFAIVDPRILFRIKNLFSWRLFPAIIVNSYAFMNSNVCGFRMENYTNWKQSAHSFHLSSSK